MSEPISFENASPRFALPYLYAGQAQKEFYVNEALAIADALLHCAIEGATASPPDAPVDGQNWCVASGATGDWAGRDGQIACRQSGAWRYILPQDGMRVFDRFSGASWLYANGWKIPEAISMPAGGNNVDTEARATLGQLINALKRVGILS